MLVLGLVRWSLLPAPSASTLLCILCNSIWNSPQDRSSIFWHLSLYPLGIFAPIDYPVRILLNLALTNQEVLDTDVVRGRTQPHHSRSSRLEVRSLALSSGFATNLLTICIKWHFQPGPSFIPLNMDDWTRARVAKGLVLHAIPSLWNGTRRKLFRSHLGSGKISDQLAMSAMGEERCSASD